MNRKQLFSIILLIATFALILVWSLPLYDTLYSYSLNPSPHKQFALWINDVTPDDSVIVAGEYAWVVMYYTELPDPIWGTDPSWVSYSVERDLINGKHVFIISSVLNECGFLREKFELRPFAMYDSILSLYEIYPRSRLSQNLVPNPSFEEDVENDGVPDFWRKSQDSGTGSLSATDTNSKHGSKSLKASADNSSSKIVAELNNSALIPIQPDKKYYWEVWVKSQHINNTDISIEFYFLKGDNVTLVGYTGVWLQNGDGTWQKKSGIFTPKDFGDDTIRYLRVRLSCHNPANAPAYVLFDGIEVREFTEE